MNRDDDVDTCNFTGLEAAIPLLFPGDDVVALGASAEHKTFVFTENFLLTYPVFSYNLTEPNLP